MSLPNLSEPRKTSTTTVSSLPSKSPSTLSMSQESYPEICALLVTYLTSLPAPLIHRCFADALWSWCVSPSLLRHEQRLRRQGDDDASSSSSSDSGEDSDEQSYSTRLRNREEALLNLPPLRVQIKIARQVLLLLPQRQFGVIVYLMTFFSTMQVAPDSGLSPEDVGRIFGAALAGGRRRRDSVVAADGESTKPNTKLKSAGRRVKEEKGQSITTWLVTHWGEIASAYEIEEGDRIGRRQSRMSFQDEGMGTRSMSVDIRRGRMPRRDSDSPPRRLEKTRFARENNSKGKERAEMDLNNEVETTSRVALSEQADSMASLNERRGEDCFPFGTPQSTQSTQEVTCEHADKAQNEDYNVSAPRIELPPGISQEEKLFATPAPFDINTSDVVDDDMSVYSSGKHLIQPTTFSFSHAQNKTVAQYTTCTRPASSVSLFQIPTFPSMPHSRCLLARSLSYPNSRRIRRYAYSWMQMHWRRRDLF